MRDCWHVTTNFKLTTKTWDGIFHRFWGLPSRSSHSVKSLCVLREWGIRRYVCNVTHILKFHCSAEEQNGWIKEKSFQWKKKKIHWFWIRSKMIYLHTVELHCVFFILFSFVFVQCLCSCHCPWWACHHCTMTVRNTQVCGKKHGHVERFRLCQQPAEMLNSISRTMMLSWLVCQNTSCIHLVAICRKKMQNNGSKGISCFNRWSF